MANTPQGNAVAYRSVQPVEAAKVGELYSGMIDYMIKEKKVQEAVALKRKTDEGKNLSDLMKDWKVDYKATITPMQDAANKAVLETVNKVDYAKRIAEDINYSSEDKISASQVAKNSVNDTLQLQSFLNNPQLIENYKNNLKLIGDGKAFAGDDRIGLYNSAAVGAWKTRHNNDGTIDIAYAKQNDTKDSPLEWQPISKIIEMYSTPIEESQIDDYNKNLTDLAQKITTETTNDNGVIKTYSKLFDANDAKILLASSFGYDPDKPLDSQFSRNAVPRQLDQWYWQKEGKRIDSNEDFQKAIDGSVEQMRASADEKQTREVKQTALDLSLKEAELANKRANTRKTNEREAKVPAVTISDNTDGIIRITKSATGDGTKDGNAQVYKNGTVINLKNKEAILGYKVPNSDGKGFHTEYAQLGRDENGRFGFKETMSRQDVATKLGGYGYDFNFINSRVLKGNSVDNSQKIKTSVKTLKEFNQSKEFTSEDDGW